jgi:hypothetical protein
MKKNVLTIAFALLFLSPTVACNAVQLSSETFSTAMQSTIFKSDTISSDLNEATPSKSLVAFDGSAYDFIFSWKKKAKESHWTGFGFAFSNLNGLESGRLDLSRSYSVILNVGDYIVPFNNNWLMATGLGFDWSRYHFRGSWHLQATDGRTSFIYDPVNSYRDSKLLVYYATVPLLLEYQTKLNNRKAFFVYGGVEGLLKLYSKSQAEIKTGSNIRKETYKGLNLIPLNFRFTARIGFSDFSLFGYYQPLSMFEKGAGPDLCPYGLGVMLNF